MKTLLTALLSLCALVTLPAFASNTADGVVTVGGYIVKPMGISVGGNILMPDVVKPTAPNVSTVKITCNSAGVQTLTYDALGGNPFADGAFDFTNGIAGLSNNALVAAAETAGACSTVTVTGENDFNFQVTTGSEVAATDAAITVSQGACYSAGGNLMSDNSSTSTLSNTGTLDLYCGAEVSVTSAVTAETSYNDASYTVTVTYD